MSWIEVDVGSGVSVDGGAVGGSEVEVAVGTGVVVVVGATVVVAAVLVDVVAMVVTGSVPSGRVDDDDSPSLQPAAITRSSRHGARARKRLIPGPRR